MELTTAKQPGSQMELTFRLDEADVDRAFQKVYQQLAQEATIPGFRRGRAPAAVIRRRFKPEVLREMFWMKAVETFVEPELEKSEFQLIGQPEFPDFEQIEVAEGQPVEFSLRITVRPTPELPEYKGLKLYRIIPEVPEAQVEAVLEEMRQAAAKEKPVTDRPVQAGDIVTVNLRITLAGQSEPIHESSQRFEVGSGRYQPPIDEALIGHRLDETVTLEHEYPADHEDPELAGQKATLAATIEEIRERVLPELNDELARAHGDAESLEELRANIRQRLEQEAARRSRETLENDALAAVVRDTKIDLPEILVAEVARRGFEAFVAELQEHGMTPAEFAEIAGTDIATLEENERVRAELALKIQFTLEAIAQAEGVEVDEAALEEEIALFAAEANVGEDFVRNALALQDELRQRLEDRARRRLTIQRLIEAAEIEDVSAERYAEIKAQERQAAREAEEAAAAASAPATEEEAQSAATETPTAATAEPTSAPAEAGPAAEEAALASSQEAASTTSAEEGGQTGSCAP